MSIGHRLLGHAGKCAHVHGHNYIFEVSIQGNVNEIGLVIDFADLKRVMKQILEPFDHALVLHEKDPLAEVLRTEKLVLLSVNPSAEHFASLLFGKLIDFNVAPSSVRVQETEDGWALAEKVDRTVRIKAVQ
jgi:6-pyruvoyltetrahydropterin/6-carboxytetrahydropterin synthase